MRVSFKCAYFRWGRVTLTSFKPTLRLNGIHLLNDLNILECFHCFEKIGRIKSLQPLYNTKEMNEIFES